MILGYVVLGALLLAVAGELSLRAYVKLVKGWKHLGADQYTRFHRYVGHAAAPGYDRHGVVHNGQGFRRSEDVTLQKPPGTIRVFTVGGSAAYGLGSQYRFIHDAHAHISNSETIDAYLEEELSRACPGMKVEVINAAMSSQYSHQDLLRYLTDLYRYDPDIVVAIDGYNDFFFFHEDFDLFFYSPYQAGAYRFAEHERLRDLALYAARCVGRHSLLVRKVFEQAWAFWSRSSIASYLRLVPMPSLETPAQRQAFREVYERVARRSWHRVWRQFAAACREDGVEALFCFQPILLLQDPAKLTPQEKWMFDFSEKAEREVNRDRPMALEVYAVVKSLMEELKGRGIAVLDLNEAALNCWDQKLTDYCHLSPHGNRYCAGEIARYLGPKVDAIFRKSQERKTAVSSTR